MTFASDQDLRDRFGDQELLLLADRDNDGVLDVAVLAAARGDADAEIVSLVAGGATIDPGNVPTNLVRIACDFVRYRLYSNGNAPDDVRKRYEDGVKFLGLVRKGEAGLDGGSVNVATPQASPKAAASEPGSRIFKRGL